MHGTTIKKMSLENKHFPSLPLLSWFLGICFVREIWTDFAFGWRASRRELGCVIKVSRSGISKCESRKGRMRWISIATVLIWLSKCEAFGEMQNCWWLFHIQSVYHYSGCFWTSEPWNGVVRCGLNRQSDQLVGSPRCICLVPRNNFITCNWITGNLGF